MHIYRLEREGKFPKRIQLGPNAVGWIEHEVDAWIESKMAQRENAA
jgi:prophage regulatory protein